jgi:2-dehydro-3-deoxyphosphooctonate aldolase (KDO 8-P synthase)
VGIGDENALKVLRNVSDQFDIPVVTDIHTSDDAERASQYVDILQIPAFLCRQTDLLISAASTGRIVNIKKGQFLSGDSMKYAVEKVKGAGNNGVMLTERGSMFGYADLVVDYRNIIAMKSFNVPVVMDVTHSLQQPNQKSGVTGGQPELIETIARAGIAVGADGIFMETHSNPGKAKSDAANMLHLDLVEDLMSRLVSLRKVINEFGE